MERIKWYPRKTERQRRAPANFYALHPNPKRSEDRKAQERDDVITDIMADLDQKKIDKMMKEEGITAQQHHFDPKIS